MVKVFYFVAGLYDFLLGVVFLFLFERIYAFFEIELPNHPGYVQFPALLLMIFGLMFFQIAKDPQRNSNLIVFGVMLKAAYCSVVLGHQAFGSIPVLWVPWAWLDLVFLVGFIVTGCLIARDNKA